MSPYRLDVERSPFRVDLPDEMTLGQLAQSGAAHPQPGDTATGAPPMFGDFMRQAAGYMPEEPNILTRLALGLRGEWPQYQERRAADQRDIALGLMRQESQRQDTQRSVEQQSLASFERAAKLPKHVRGPYLDHLSAQYERLTGRPFNPTVLDVLKKGDDEMWANLSTALTDAGYEPGKLFSLVQALGETDPAKALDLFFQFQKHSAERERQQAIEGLLGGTQPTYAEDLLPPTLTRRAPLAPPPSAPTYAGPEGPPVSPRAPMEPEDEQAQLHDQRSRLERVWRAALAGGNTALANAVQTRLGAIDTQLQGKPFAPTELQAWYTEAARQLGKTYRPGGPIEPDVNKRALELFQNWRRETFAPKGPETSIASRAERLALSRGVPMEAASQIYEKALRDSAWGLSYLRAAGRLEAELESPGTGPTRPGTAAPSPPGTTGEGTAPAPSRRAQISQQAQAGEVAKAMQQFSVVRAYIEEIDALSKPLVNAKKAPETYWQAAKIAGGRVTNYDQLAQYYEERKEAFLGSMSRTVGAQVGVLTQLDVDAMRRLFPTAGNTMAQREAKLNSLKALVRINQAAHKARVTSGGELPESEYAKYRQTIDAEIAKMERAAGMNRQPSGGSAADFLRKYNITPGRR